MLSPLAAHYVFRSVVQAAVLKVNAHPLCALVHTRSASCEQLPSSGPIRPYSHSLHVHAECVGDGLPSSVLDDSIGRHSAALRRCGCSIAATFRHHCLALPCLALPCLAICSTYRTASCVRYCAVLRACRREARLSEPQHVQEHLESALAQRPSSRAGASEVLTLRKSSLACAAHCMFASSTCCTVTSPALCEPLPLPFVLVDAH